MGYTQRYSSTQNYSRNICCFHCQNCFSWKNNCFNKCQDDQKNWFEKDDKFDSENRCDNNNYYDERNGYDFNNDIFDRKNHLLLSVILFFELENRAPFCHFANSLKSYYGSVKRQQSFLVSIIEGN